MVDEGGVQRPGAIWHVDAQRFLRVNHCEGNVLDARAVRSGGNASRQHECRVDEVPGCHPPTDFSANEGRCLMRVKLLFFAACSYNLVVESICFLPGIQRDLENFQPSLERPLSAVFGNDLYPFMVDILDEGCSTAR